MMIKILQFNANNCIAAMSLLAQYEIENNISISAISEYHKASNDGIWYENTTGKIAIHLVTQNYNDSIGVLKAKGEYSVLVEWREFCIVACYVSPNIPDNEYLSFLDELDSMIVKVHHRKLIILGDFNARDYAWGDRITNNRGDKVLSWAVGNDLCLINEGKTTCVRSQGNSVIDLTWCTSDISRMTKMESTGQLYVLRSYVHRVRGS